MRGSRRLGASFFLSLVGAFGFAGRAAAELPAPALEGTKAASPVGEKEAAPEPGADKAEKGDCKLELVLEHPIASRVKLSIDGERVAADPGGVTVDTSAGRHMVTAVVGLTKVDFVTHVEPGQKKTLRVSLPRSAPHALAPLAVLPPLADADSAPSSDAWQRSAGLVVGGAGVLGLGVAGAYFADALHKRNEAAKACNGPTPCEPKARQTLDAKAAESSDIAAVAAVTGFALAGAGALLFLTAPKPPGMRDLRFSPTFASGGGGGISAKATF